MPEKKTVSKSASIILHLRSERYSLEILIFLRWSALVRVLQVALSRETEWQFVVQY